MPVTLQQVQVAKGQLDTAAKRLADALETMLANPDVQVEIRNHVTMKEGVKKIVRMASEVRDKAEDAATSKEMGVPTKVEQNRQHHAAYDKPAKKTSKATKKRTEAS